ncbi:MAG: aminotransferase class V-fold PLP-dependent enzyme [Parvularculaceae bacterium]
MPLDIDFVRSHFPPFTNPALKDQAFFESAGGSYACNHVIDRLTRFYRERKVQPYWPFDASRLGGEEMDEARRRLSAMLGVDEDELSFGPSTTQNTYVLAQAFAETLAPGDAIIVTNQDHEANSGPWRRLEKRGFEIREWSVEPDTGHLPLEGLDALLDDKVKLVAFPHCSNVVGEINPVKEIADRVHAAGAVFCVDGVSYAPHGFPDVKSLGADIYLFSAYKTYGPHQGIMVVRRALGERLANQGHYFNADSLTKKFTPAGPDHAQIAACAGMADYVDALYAHHLGDDGAPPLKRAGAVHDLMRGHEKKLLQPVLDYLAAKNTVRLLGPASAEKRAPTIALALQENGEQVAKRLAAKGVNCGGGAFYADRLLNALDVDQALGGLRISFVHYTSKAEVEKLLRALDEHL